MRAIQQNQHKQRRLRQMCLRDISIEIANVQSLVVIDSEQLKQTVLGVLSHFNVRNAHVSIAVVDHDEIRRLKRAFFDMDIVTDVISIDLSDDPEACLECEIIVNAQMAKEVTKDKINHTVEAELNLYVVHGLLHKLGYEDDTDVAHKIMHAKEDEILTLLGFGKVFKGKDYILL